MAKGALDDIARLKQQQYERRQAKIIVIEAKPQKIAEVKQAVADVTNRITNAQPKPSPSERTLKWRAENPERYKTTQRDLMKKRRAKK